MKIDLIDVVSNDNKTSEFEICLEATDININGIDCGVVCSPCFFMRVTNQAGARLDIEADGEVKLSVPCDRCLEPVEITVDVNIDEQIQLENGELVGEKPDFVDAKAMDVESAILDSIFQNFPSKVLCDEDCKGLCLKCGKNLNLGECGCDRFVQDPRMAAFNNIFDQFRD